MNQEHITNKTSRKNLEAIIILSDPHFNISEKRTKRALKEFEGNNSGKLIATGGKTSYLSQDYETESDIIIQILKSKNIPEDRILTENTSTDTIGNLLHAFQNLPYQRIGIASNPGQLYRAIQIVREAKRQGKISREIRIFPLRTEYSWGEEFYESIVVRRVKKTGASLEPEISKPIEAAKYFLVKIYSGLNFIERIYNNLVRKN